MNARRRSEVGRRERRIWIAAAVLALAVAVVAGIGIVAHGFHRAEPELSDASVWVANTATGQLGRANTAVAAIDTTVSLEGDGAVIAQDRQRVVMHSSEKNTLTVLDAARAKVLATVNLPEGDSQVVTAGSTIGVLDPSKGDIWVRSLRDIQDFDASTTPDAQVGTDAVLAVGEQGNWAGFSRSSSRVTVGAQGKKSRVDKVDFSGPTDRVQVSLMGQDPVIYNQETNQLYAFSSTRDLSGVVTDPDSVKLAQPVVGNQDSDVVLAHDAGLVSVGRHGDGAELPVDGMDSLPGSPVKSGTCWYGAWAEGKAAQWCEGRDPESFNLPSANGKNTPQIRVNGRTVVAENSADGVAWALQRGGALISNWDDFNDTAETVKHRRDDTDVPPTPEKAPKPPEANDDELGARPGRANVLPVLLNDSDPNGDALLITSVDAPAAGKGSVQVVENGQKLQFTPRAEATGTVRFSYTVDDGHGGQDSADVAVKLVPKGQNHAPVQQRSTRTTVAQGGHVGVDVLDDWVDPESDPIYLDSATANAPDQVGAEPSGRLDLTHGGGEPGLDTIKTVVSDGRAKGTGQVNVTVAAKGETPILTENTTLTGRIGTEILTQPTELARGGDGELQLTRAEVTKGDPEGLKTSVLYSDGSVRMTPTQAGSYEVTYAVSDGDDSERGIIRVVVEPSDEDDLEPVVSPATAFVRLKDSTETDILAHAYDPAGGVLTVTGVSAAPEGTGVDTEIVDGRRVKTTLLKDLDSPMTLTVTVSNGTASAQAELNLVQIPEPTQLQAPVARDDTATVRAGEIVDIPVLENDSHPDGKPLELTRKLVSEPGAGLMVVSGEKLRFLAPDEPGTFTARYGVRGPDGRESVGEVRVVVNALDAAENRAPSAPTVTARTKAGQPVTIPVPLDGADPDGDAVTVSAVVKAPTHGAIKKVDGRELVYVPFEQSAGTDQFTYRVTDPLGATSTGTVRVGVEDADAPVRAPTAADDLVTTRPGTDLSLDVLANDTDPNGKGLTIAEATAPSGGVKVSTEGHRIRFTAPEEQGSVNILYRVTDPRGAASSAWLTVDVKHDAPPAAPSTQDRQLSLSDVEGRSTVPVDVLETTSFTEGNPRDLKVSLPQGWSDASVDDQGRVVVPVQAERGIIPFTVSRRDTDGGSSTAFITVPGTDEAPPELRKDAPPLSVRAGETLKIDLSKQIIAAKNRSVAISDPEQVLAMNGTVEADGRSSLLFHTKANGWGPAAISVPVTDGRTRATVLLPVTVVPQSNPAPVMRAGTLSVESADHREVDLRSLTEVAGTEAGRFDGLTWSVSQGNASVAKTRVSGHKLSVTAAETAKPGDSTRLRLSVTDAQGRSSSADFDVSVISSTKPPPLAHADSVGLRRGESKSVDVLANDVSPFPGRDLNLTGVRVATAVNGVTVTRDGQRIKVRAGDHADTGTASVVYSLGDASNDPARQAEGVLRVNVQDVPGAPGAPNVTEHPQQAAVELNSTPSEPNGEEITHYDYRVDGGAAHRCGIGPRGCRVDGLSYGKHYRFAMRAVNSVGAGDWSAASRSVVMDRKPDSPTKLRLKPSTRDRSGHTLEASWSAPPAAPWGSDVVGYVVKVAGPSLPDGGVVRTVKGVTDVIKDGRIRPGQEYSVQVSAKNARYVSSPATDRTRAVAAPKIVKAESGLNQDGTRAQVVFDVQDGGAQAQAQVVPRRDGNGSGTCSPKGFHPNVDGNTWSTKLDPDVDPVFTLRVSNGVFCTSTVTKKVDTTVGTPSGSTHVKDDRDGAEQGGQPSYRIKPGSPAAKYFFVHFGSSRPSAESDGWKQVAGNRDIDFGTTDEPQTVWAMNCRSAERGFCSKVAKIGTETKRGVDLNVEATADQDSCRADGTSKIQLKAADGVKIEYRFDDDDFADAPKDGVVVPERGPGEKVALWLRSSKHGYSYTPKSAALTCEGPQNQSDFQPEDMENAR